MLARFAKLIGIFQLLFIGSWLVTPVCLAERVTTVALVIDTDSRIHEEAVTGIMQTVEKSANNNIHFRTFDINSPETSTQLQSSGIDFAIVVGVKPALFALERNLAYPVLYTLIPENTYKEIVEKRLPAQALSPADDYVIYLGQPAERQLALVKFIAGDKNRLGMVTGGYSQHKLKALEDAASKKAIQLVSKQATSEKTAIDDIKQVLMDSDIYLALYDTHILSRHNTKWLLYMAYKMNKPVIGFSSSYTRAGAVASMFSTPGQIGHQSGEWLLAMVSGQATAHQQYPKYFSITTNPSIQRLLRMERLSGDEIKHIILNDEKASRND